MDKISRISTYAALHKYFLYASQMQSHFEMKLRAEVAGSANPQPIEPVRDVYMSLWYGTLYTVVEGWVELRLTHDYVDALLATSENVNLLRRCRNTIFHYQNDYTDDRYLEFISKAGIVPWITSLHRGFSDWFLEKI
jgi:hypothetical protein